MVYPDRFEPVVAVQACPDDRVVELIASFDKVRSPAHTRRFPSTWHPCDS